MKTVAAKREMVLAEGVGDVCGAAKAGKTAAIYVELTMEAVGHIFHGGDFYNSAKLAAIFGGKRGGQHAHGFHVVGVELRRKGGRAILSERQSIENILHIVFRPAGMKNAIGFIEPARLLIDEFAKTAARLGDHFLIDGLSADGINSAGAAGSTSVAESVT